MDVQVKLEITGGSEQASRLELALRKRRLRARVAISHPMSFQLQNSYYQCVTLDHVHAGDDSYDGVPYADLAFTEVDWSEAIDHIRHRGQRQGQSAEFNLEPEWATEALADPRRLVGSAGSRSGLTIKVLGWSPNAPARQTGQRGRLVKVIVAPKDHPPTGRW